MVPSLDISSGRSVPPHICVINAAQSGARIESDFH